MKHLAAMVALAMCCFVVPINGQSPGKNPEANRQHSADTQAPKGKNSTPSTVNVETVNVNKLNVPQQPETAGKSDEDNDKPPPYLHRLIAPETLPNTILCLIGIAGVVAALFTLRAMKEQAVLMERQAKVMEGQLGSMNSSGEQQTKLIEAAHKSADAALLNAQAIINSERPWLFIQITVTNQAFPVDQVSEHMSFSIKFRNWGKTPAEVVFFDQHLECRKDTDDLPSPPEYGLEGHVMAHTRMVPAGESWATFAESYFWAENHLLPEDWKEIRSSRKRLLYWGRLQYRDLIEESKTIHELKSPLKLHETCFCYFWSPALNEFLICGPFGYNKHT